jgi:hypothetical protein
MDMFLHADIKPANPNAEKLARAIIKLIYTEQDLVQARKNVPQYTGHLDYDDYIADEQENWNRAADALFELIRIDSSKN